MKKIKKIGLWLIIFAFAFTTVDSSAIERSKDVIGANSSYNLQCAYKIKNNDNGKYKRIDIYKKGDEYKLIYDSSWIKESEFDGAHTTTKNGKFEDVFKETFFYSSDEVFISNTAKTEIAAGKCPATAGFDTFGFHDEVCFGSGKGGCDSWFNTAGDKSISIERLSENEIKALNENNTSKDENDKFHMAFSDSEYVGENFCSEPGTMATLNVIAWIILLAKMFIPTLIVMWGTFDFYKAVTNGEAAQMKKSAQSLGLRVVMGIFIFFLPTMVSSFIGYLLPDDYDKCATCMLNPGSCKGEVLGSTTDTK